MIDYRPDTSWPPVAVSTPRALISEWDAWYQGSDLAGFYGASLRQGVQQISPRPSQLSGGVVGRVARFWWGDPIHTSPDLGGRPMYHVPLAAEIASAASDLLFGDEVQIDAFPGDDAKAEALGRILDANNLPALLAEAGETQSKDGGVYFRVVTDPQVDEGRPIISKVSAEAAIPTFRWGRLMSVQFWSIVKTDGSTIYRLVEEWTPDGVEYALFEGGTDRIGNRVPLAECDATADLQVNADSMIPTAGMCAFYVPNLLPGMPGFPELGQSDFAHCIPLLDALDRIYTNWMRDLDAAKGRIIASRDLLESRGAGQGADVNVDRDVFVPVNVPVNIDKPGLPLEAVQFEMDVSRYRETFTATVEEILRASGYSPQTFGIGDAAGQRTATEIRAFEARSMATREKKTRYWTNALEAMIDAVAREAGLGEARTVVTFPPAAQASQLELAQTATALRSAQAASTETLVRLTQPDLDDEQVAVEVRRIQSETAAPALADPLALGNSLVDSGPAMSPEELQKAADAMGVLIRTGATFESAAAATGLSGLVSDSGRIPTTLRLPDSQAASMEGTTSPAGG